MACPRKDAPPAAAVPPPPEQGLARASSCAHHEQGGSKWLRKPSSPRAPGNATADKPEERYVYLELFTGSFV